MVELKKVSDKLEWKDISHEKYRTYTFVKDEKFFNVKILEPALLNVSKSGGHRILDSNNMAHYIPWGWIHLFWETKDDLAFRF